jgi:hypothetical protein
LGGLTGGISVGVANNDVMTFRVFSLKNKNKFRILFLRRIKCGECSSGDVGCTHVCLVMINERVSVCCCLLKERPFRVWLSRHVSATALGCFLKTRPGLYIQSYVSFLMTN